MGFDTIEINLVPAYLCILSVPFWQNPNLTSKQPQIDYSWVWYKYGDNPKNEVNPKIEDDPKIEYATKI